MRHLTEGRYYLRAARGQRAPVGCQGEGGDLALLVCHDNPRRAPALPAHDVRVRALALARIEALPGCPKPADTLGISTEKTLSPRSNAWLAPCQHHTPLIRVGSFVEPTQDVPSELQ